MKERLDGGRVRGGILQAHLHWVEDQRLPGGITALKARVSDETARVLDGPVLPISWYPFRALVEADRATAALAGGDEKATVVELGRHSARRNLAAGYRFYNRSQPHEFFATVTRMHPQYLDFGREEYESAGPTACRILLLDHSCYSKIYCWSALGYYEQATAFQGGREPEVAEVECACEGAPRCCFELRWS
jgi:hypothetical protein